MLTTTEKLYESKAVLRWSLFVSYQLQLTLRYCELAAARDADCEQQFFIALSTSYKADLRDQWVGLAVVLAAILPSASGTLSEVAAEGDPGNQTVLESSIDRPG